MQEQFGSYCLTKKLVSKPLRSTYLAHPLIEVQRQVVIKIFQKECISLEQDQEQSLLYVRSLVSLQHPHIVPILDIAIEKGLPYIVTEYCSLPSLQSRLFSSPLPWQQVLPLILQLGDALIYTHQNGIIHGNLKPGNIFCSNDNNEKTVRLTDFSLSPFIHAARLDYKSDRTTIRYMAPEQFVGKTGPASDQYALACLAYELISGHPLFEAQSFASMWGKHNSEKPILLSTYSPEVPSALDQALLKALSKAPEARYPEIATFIAVLASIQKEHVPLESTPTIATENVSQPTTIVADDSPAAPATDSQVASSATLEDGQFYVYDINEAPNPDISDMKTIASIAAVPADYIKVLANEQSKNGEEVGTIGSKNGLDNDATQIDFSPQTQKSKRPRTLLLGAVVLAVITILGGVLMPSLLKASTQPDPIEPSKTPVVTHIAQSTITSTPVPTLQPTPTVIVPTAKPTTRPIPTPTSTPVIRPTPPPTPPNQAPPTVATPTPTANSIAINAGGDATGSFGADTGADAGSMAGSGDVIDTSGVSNPAPQEVYQSNRWGNTFTYTISNLNRNASYTVRLHFAETYWDSSGVRIFNVNINGTQVLTNFDIYNTAGGRDRAVIEQFKIKADNKGTIAILFTTVADNAQVNGIEILGG